MIDRRTFLCGITLGTLIASLAAEAQQVEKMYRVGFLGPAAERVYTDSLRALRAGLAERGYVEGRNIAFESRFAEDKFERLPGLAAELIRNKVDIIVVHSTPGTRAAKQATSTIPIVMASSGDPIGTGLVTSLGHPGGNVTGISSLDVGLAAKRLELLKEILPRVSLVAVLHNPTNPAGGLQLKETQDAARTLGVKIQTIDVRDLKELEIAFAVMLKPRVDAFTALADPLFLSQQEQIAKFAATSRLPSIFARRENVDAGGLISYGPTLAGQFRQAATFVDRILRGAKPGDLPVEEPTRLFLLINLKTAKALGLTIPPTMLLRADHVIE